MFPRVLVATDFSRYADRILDCIGEIPGMEEILLVHVRTRPDNRAPSQLEEKGEHLHRTAGLPVRTLLVEEVGGDIARGIISAANMHNCSLIVLGARGKGFIGELLLGSVSKEVVRRAGIDVLVMRFRGLEGEESALLEKFCRNLFSHVLCPIDFSKPSEKTLEYLPNLEGVRRVTLLHVPGEEEANRQRIDWAEQKTLGIESDLESRGIQADSLIRTGDPVREICRAAEERDVSLILIARFGQSDYASNIPLGHVAAGVADLAQRPLFVLSPHISLTIHTRELRGEEFGLAEEVWRTYHQQKGDPVTDRIFGVFVEGVLVAVAGAGSILTDGRWTGYTCYQTTGTGGMLAWPCRLWSMPAGTNPCTCIPPSPWCRSTGLSVLRPSRSLDYLPPYGNVLSLPGAISPVPTSLPCGVLPKRKVANPR
jgi:Universal stress protein UspA and related nucleotide-binding proteins